MTEMVGWHHRLNAHELEQTLEDREGQGKSGMLQSMGFQRVEHDIATEQQKQNKADSLSYTADTNTGKD